MTLTAYDLSHCGELFQVLIKHRIIGLLLARIHISDSNGGHGDWARWKPSFVSAHASSETDAGWPIFERVLRWSVRVAL